MKNLGKINQLVNCAVKWTIVFFVWLFYTVAVFAVGMIVGANIQAGG